MGRRRRGRRGAPTLAVLCGLAAGCASATAELDGVPDGGRGFRVSGYHPAWTGDAWRDYPADLLHRVYFFELESGPDGSLDRSSGWPDAWGDLRRWARHHHLELIPTVSLHGPEAFEAVFADPDRSRALTADLVDLLRADPAAAGLHLDVEVFEPVSTGARDGFTAFVVGLRRAVDRLPERPSLSLFLPALDPADAYNERALAAAVDEVVLQGYDLHHRAGPRAGPVAPPRGWPGRSWTDLLARFDSLGVPRDRLAMGVPLYGYEWPTVDESSGAATRGEGVVLALDPRPDLVPELARAAAEAARHGVRRDPASGVPWYAGRTEDGWVQGWFEDTVSLEAKVAFARRHGLAGVALFPLAYGGPAEWGALRRAVGR